MFLGTLENKCVEAHNFVENFTHCKENYVKLFAPHIDLTSTHLKALFFIINATKSQSLSSLLEFVSEMSLSSINLTFCQVQHIIQQNSCVRTWWPPAQTHHQFVTGSKLFCGAYCIRGHFILGGLSPSQFFDWGPYGAVAFVWELLARGF